MEARGFPVSSQGVAECYGDILDIMVIDQQDTANGKGFPVRTVRCDTLMTSVEKSKALAVNILGLFRDIG
jgi:LPPG:FO 2-phospho-L-lactate transferase